MTSSITFYLILVGLAYATAATFTDCGGLFKNYTIKVSNCDGQGPCELIRGKNSSLKITFKPDMEVKTVLSKVYGKIAGATIPFPIPNPDGCKDSGLQCPLEKDIEYTYTITIPVKRLYPQISLKIMWELYGDRDKLIICSIFDAILR